MLGKGHRCGLIRQARVCHARAAAVVSFSRSEHAMQGPQVLPHQASLSMLCKAEGQGLPRPESASLHSCLASSRSVQQVQVPLKGCTTHHTLQQPGFCSRLQIWELNNHLMLAQLVGFS